MITLLLRVLGFTVLLWGSCLGDAAERTRSLIPDGRRLSISVVAVTAQKTPSLPDPIVVLMGGPGEDAVGSAGFYAARFAPLLNDRDLLLIDQRGTGKSAALACVLYSVQEQVSALAPQGNQEMG